MKKILLLAATAAILIAGCGNRSSAEPTESILWKITGNGLSTPSYLLGTHHFAPVSILDEYPAYTEALASAEIVIGEVDMETMNAAQALMMESAMLPEGTTYHDLLTEEQYARLDELLTGMFGAGLAQFGNFKPAMILNMYTALSYSRANPSFNIMMHVPIDSYIQNLGRESGKEIAGFETFEEQISLLMDFEPLPVQAELLLCSLENDEDSVEKFIEMDNLYKEGNLQGMYDMSFDNDDEPCRMSDEFELAINKLRNDKWMAQIPGIISEKPAFIAVGALHLAGEEGLINQLREAGFTVVPIR